MALPRWHACAGRRGPRAGGVARGAHALRAGWRAGGVIRICGAGACRHPVRRPVAAPVWGVQLLAARASARDCPQYGAGLVPGLCGAVDCAGVAAGGRGLLAPVAEVLVCRWGGRPGAGARGALRRAAHAAQSQAESTLGDHFRGGRARAAGGGSRARSQLDRLRGRGLLRR